MKPMWLRTPECPGEQDLVMRRQDIPVTWKGPPHPQSPHLPGGRQLDKTDLRGFPQLTHACATPRLELLLFPCALLT